MKVMNVVFGIGIAVILFIVVMLGTQVFYKEPMWEKYNCSYPNNIYVYDLSNCPGNITVAQCNNMIKQVPVINDTLQKQYDACNSRFNEDQKIYGKNLFIINNAVGIILVIISLFLFAMINIAAGTAFSGLALIIYGFIRGWQGTGDILKFVVALIVAVLFIYLAIFVNRKYNKDKSKKR